MQKRRSSKKRKRKRKKRTRITTSTMHIEAHSKHHEKEIRSMTLEIEKIDEVITLVASIRRRSTRMTVRVTHNLNTIE